MYKTYIKQAWQLLKDHPFISVISITGTALAIQMIMVILVADEIKTVNASPEINRSRTLYLFCETRILENKEKPEDSQHNGGPIRYDVVKLLLQLKTPSYVSAMNSVLRSFQHGISEIHAESSNLYYPAFIRPVDANFWKIMSFHFTEGRPFTAEEFNSGVKVAVIKKSLARQISNGESVLGKYVIHDFENYRVIGVVEDVPQIFREAEGDFWIPYTSQKEWEKSTFEVLLVANHPDDFPAIREEVESVVKKFDADHQPWKLFLPGPFTVKQYINKMYLGAQNKEKLTFILNAIKGKEAFTFLILLLIPSLNLSNFSLSRMKKRMAEIGIRKAFGAKKKTILLQVLFENLLTSFIGGFIGLIMSYITVIGMQSWLLGISNSGHIPIGTYFSWQILLTVTIVCVILNLLSAGIPAYRASQMNIVDSLNQKR